MPPQPGCQTEPVQEAFGIVLFVVVGVAAVLAAVAFAGSGNVYRQIGRGGLSLDRDDDHRRRPAPGGALADAERDAEVRQMLTARNARRVARGETALDVETELARLTRPVIDPGSRPRSASWSSPATSVASARASRRSTSRPRSRGRSPS